jgi:tripartite-type tricarboxylate transporter receptor subunit TctC
MKEEAMRLIRKALLAALCCTVPALAAGNAQAQTYPSKPIRFIVAYTTGGLGDTFARALGNHLGQRLGQPVVIENRPGASQVIALDATAKAAPDGHTLAYGTQSGMVFTTATKKSLPYDPVKDFASIGMLFQTPFYLVVHPSVPANNVQEFIAYVKANPGKLSFASIGVGSGQHLAMELFRNRTGLDMLHVPYKGSAPASIDLVAGQVQAMFEGPTTSAPHIRSGKLRALASSGAQRTRSMPQVPTVIESGVPGYEMATWFGLQTVAGVPRPAIERLNHEVNQWLRSPEGEKLGDRFSLDFTPSTPEQMSERIRREIPVFVKLMRAAGIEPE